MSGPIGGIALLQVLLRYKDSWAGVLSHIRKGL